MKNIINQSILLSKKYDVVVTNPPYMGNNGMNPNLKDYIKSKFPLTKTDLFAVFLEKGLEMIKDYGFNCMVTMQSWMFLSSFEKFRKKLIETTTISNLLHMDNMVMKIAFGTSATVFRKINLMNYNSTFYHVKLSDVENDIVNPLFFNDKNKFVISQYELRNVPGNLIAYWVSKNFIKSFNKQEFLKSSSKNIKYAKLNELGIAKKGIVTGDNDTYMKMFWEVNLDDINKKWVLCAKGGNYKKYYGNIEMVIDWSKDAQNFYKINKSSSSMPEKYCFKEGITYTTISSKGTGFRLLPNNSLFSNGGPSIIKLDENLIYCMGFLNSKVAGYYLSVLNPTINILSYNVNALPIIIDLDNKMQIEELTMKNIKIEENNWNFYENSFDFKIHPLLKFDTKSIEKSIIH